MKKTLLSFILLSTVSLTAFAQCKVTHAPSFSLNAATGYVAGQSFTATCGGNLNYLQITANSTGTVPAGTLNVYAGDGTSTTPIYTQSFPAMTIANVGDPIRVMVTGSLPITNASQYTGAFFINLDVLADNTYAGGQAYQSGVATGVDVDFEVDITAVTGVDELAVSTTTVYPNPATNVLNITSAEQVKSVSIYTITGELVNTYSEKTINIANLTQGMYIVAIHTNDGVTQTRIIKE